MPDSIGENAQAKLDDIRRDFESLRKDLAKLRQSGVGMASGKVQERPIGAMLVAFVAGFLSGRFVL